MNRKTTHQSQEDEIQDLNGKSEIRQEWKKRQSGVIRKGCKIINMALIEYKAAF